MVQSGSPTTYRHRWDLSRIVDPRVRLTAVDAKRREGRGMIRNNAAVRRASPLDRLATSETRRARKVDGAPGRTWRRAFVTHALRRDKSARACAGRFSNQAIELRIVLRFALSVVTAPILAMTSHMSLRRHHLLPRARRQAGQVLPTGRLGNKSPLWRQARPAKGSSRPSPDQVP